MVGVSLSVLVQYKELFMAEYLKSNHYKVNGFDSGMYLCSVRDCKNDATEVMEQIIHHNTFTEDYSLAIQVCGDPEHQILIRDYLKLKAETTLAIIEYQKDSWIVGIP